MTEPRGSRFPWWYAVAALALAQFLAGALITPQRSLFPVYARTELAYSAFLISLLASLRQGLGMLGAPLGGLLADRIGNRWTFALGLSELIAGSLAFLTRWPPLVVFFWAYAGLFAGAHTVGSQGYLIEASRPALLGTISGLYNIGMTLGGAAGSALSGPLVDRLGFVHYGGVALGASLGAMLLAALALPTLTQRRQRQARPGLLDYGPLLRQRSVLMLSVMRFLPTCYWGVATVFVPLWLYDVSKSASVVAWFGTLSLVVASAAQWLVGSLADRAGRRAPYYSAASLLATASLGLALSGGRIWAIYLFGTLGASAAWSLSVLTPCLVADAIRSEERGRVLGWLHLVWNGAMLVGSLIGGALYAWRAGAPFLVTALMNLGTIGMAVAFFRVKTRQNWQA